MTLVITKNPFTECITNTPLLNQIYIFFVCTHYILSCINIRNLTKSKELLISKFTILLTIAMYLWMVFSRNKFNVPNRYYNYNNYNTRKMPILLFWVIILCSIILKILYLFEMIENLKHYNSIDLTISLITIVLLGIILYNIKDDTIIAFDQKTNTLYISESSSIDGVNFELENNVLNIYYQPCLYKYPTNMEMNKANIYEYLKKSIFEITKLPNDLPYLIEYHKFDKESLRKFLNHEILQHIINQYTREAHNKLTKMRENKTFEDNTPCHISFVQKFPVSDKITRKHVTITNSKDLNDISGIMHGQISINSSYNEYIRYRQIDRLKTFNEDRNQSAWICNECNTLQEYIDDLLSKPLTPNNINQFTEIITQAMHEYLLYCKVNNEIPYDVSLIETKETLILDEFNKQKTTVDLIANINNAKLDKESIKQCLSNDIIRHMIEQYTKDNYDKLWQTKVLNQQISYSIDFAHKLPGFNDNDITIRTKEDLMKLMPMIRYSSINEQLRYQQIYKFKTFGDNEFKLNEWKLTHNTLKECMNDYLSNNTTENNQLEFAIQSAIQEYLLYCQVNNTKPYNVSQRHLDESKSIITLLNALRNNEDMRFNIDKYIRNSISSKVYIDTLNMQIKIV